jgi:hypothetical protein
MTTLVGSPPVCESMTRIARRLWFKVSDLRSRVMFERFAQKVYKAWGGEVRETYQPPAAKPSVPSALRSGGSTPSRCLTKKSRLLRSP